MPRQKAVAGVTHIHLIVDEDTAQRYRDLGGPTHAAVYLAGLEALENDLMDEQMPENEDDVEEVDFDR